MSGSTQCKNHLTTKNRKTNHYIHNYCINAAPMAVVLVWYGDGKNGCFNSILTFWGAEEGVGGVSRQILHPYLVRSSFDALKNKLNLR